MRVKILIVAMVAAFAVATTASAQNVRTYKASFPGACMAGPTAY